MISVKTISKSLLITATVILAGCKDDNNSIPEWIWDKPSTDTGETISAKPRYIWVDAAANFPDYANSKENIIRDMGKAKDAGFTDVVIDVRPTMGDVLFKTSVVDQVVKLDYWSEGGGYDYYERTETWDYLQAFIDAGHDAGLRVHASINTFTGGNKYPYGLGEQGILFRDETKKDWATTLNTTEGLVNAMDMESDSYSTKFLNPNHPEVKTFLLTMLSDLAQYNVDGIFLDRCRYDDFLADFSELSKKAFEEYIGENVENFPNDVVVPGTKYNQLPAVLPKHFKKWLEFRAKTIHDFMVEVRTTVKGVNENIQFGAYVGAWYSSYYEVGVNWASPSYVTSLYYPKWASPQYHNFGYADHLDFLLLGAYAGVDNIYGEGEWNVQGFCKNARKILKDDVKFAGGPDVGNGTGWTDGGKNEQVAHTVDACINIADGYFVFDIIHIKKYNYWSGLKKGIDSYLETLKSETEE